MLCNMKCPYCFQRLSENWKRISPRTDHELIINQIKELDHDIHFTIIGGEPTMHPSLRSFIDRLQKLDNVKEIECYTNAKKIFDFKNREKLQLTISIHDDYTVIDNIKKYSEIFGKDKVNVILMMEENSQRKTEKIYQELKDYCNLEYNAVIDFKTLKYHQYDPCGIPFNPPHYRKGTECKIENFDINVNGDILLMCRNHGHNIRKNTLKEVIDKYLDTTIICPEEICMG